jgi:hypothetical protein
MQELSTEWARANLSAGPLGSYAFRIEATLGHRPMTYLFARSTESIGTVQHALTVLLVIAPANLAHTRITISETYGQPVPEVTLFLPTMRAPKPVTGSYLFDCLPLTDVGYVDLMAWLHPPAQDLLMGPQQNWSPWHRKTGVSMRRSVAAHGFEVVEAVSEDHGVPVARSIVLDGCETRHWEASELGDASHGYLPASIRVTRPHTGHWTVFDRSTEPCPIPAEWLGEDSETLHEAILGALGVPE